MKALVLFIDMFRPNLLNTWNHEKPVSAVDDWMKAFGGRAFLRAYTPGPDTPRSQGAMWSSRYPKFNGCNTRMKYPKFNLNNPKNNYLRVLIDAGYQINVHISNSTRVLGELPEDFENECNFSNGDSLETFLKRTDFADNSLTYLFFDDFHYAVDDFIAREGAVSFGINKIVKCIEMIDKIVDLNSFDAVLIHSDHGYKKHDDQMNSPYDWIGEKRSNVFLFLHQKGDKELLTDNKIRSVMDIGPTICEMAGLKIPYQIDGKSLFDANGSDFLVVSDHKGFEVGLTVPIVYWGVYSSKGFAAVDCEVDWKSDYPLDEETKTRLYETLSKYGDSFDENVLATRIRHYYDECVTSPSTYFDGEPRMVHYTKKEQVKMKAKGIIKALKFWSK